MEMEKITGTLFALGLVPVVKIEDAAMAPGLARALCEGGLPAAEITFRTPAAAEAIGRVHEAFPEMLLCAGTVLTPEQADAAMAAGASFIVSPGLNPRVIRHCQEKGYPVIPGCATPSDLEQALELGLQVVKFFPAEASGGVAAIKAMAAPYGGLRFMPTGGINRKNLGDYLGFGKVICCGGSFMVPSDAMEAGDFGRIAALTAEGVRAVHGFTIEELPAEGTVSPAEAAFGFGGGLKITVRSLKRMEAYLRLMGIPTVSDGETVGCKLGGFDAVIAQK